MTTLTYDQVKGLVKGHNKSTIVSDQLVIALIWKESAFNDAAINPSTTATGLMQVTKGAVDDVNNNTPQGIHFSYDDRQDAAKNIECGTYYLDLRIGWANGDVKKGLEGYGTGTGYADNILAAETCLKADGSNWKACLNAIHS